MKKLAVPFLLALATASLCGTGVQSQTNSAQHRSPFSELDKVYADESHCLIGPEIRSEKDGPISCYCRDAIVDARYVYSTYLLSGKDRNLNGTFLTLQRNAQEMCGKSYDVLRESETEKWKWDGPEVVRTYPPDDVLRQIKPDSHGMIHYQYTVVLVQRDSSGRVVKTESYTAREMEPLDFLNRGRKLLPPEQKH